MNIKTILDLLKETFAEWNKDKASRLAAALAYYTVLAPLLIIVVLRRGFGIWEEARGDCWANSRVRVRMAQKSSRRRLKMPTSQLTIASVISVVVLFLEHLVFELQDALNTVWEAKPERGLINVIRSRFVVHDGSGVGFY